jgi:hypothetical protein
MRKFIIAMCLLTLSGCAPAGPLATGKIYHTTVDGIPHDVQRMAGAEDGWAANKSDVLGGRINPADYLRNIRAIEKVSGCKVVAGTVVNLGMNTQALVKCR